MRDPRTDGGEIPGTGSLCQGLGPFVIEFVRIRPGVVCLQLGRIFIIADRRVDIFLISRKSGLDHAGRNPPHGDLTAVVRIEVASGISGEYPYDLIYPEFVVHLELVFDRGVFPERIQDFGGAPEVYWCAVHRKAVDGGHDTFSRSHMFHIGQRLWDA